MEDVSGVHWRPGPLYCCIIATGGPREQAESDQRPLCWVTIGLIVDQWAKTMGWSLGLFQLPISKLFPSTHWLELQILAFHSCKIHRYKEHLNSSLWFKKCFPKSYLSISETLLINISLAFPFNLWETWGLDWPPHLPGFAGVPQRWGSDPSLQPLVWWPCVSSQPLSAGRGHLCSESAQPALLKWFGDWTSMQLFYHHIP